MSWCEICKQYVEKNWAKGLATKDKQNPKDKRKLYDTEDIRQLINSPIYTNEFPDKHPERSWIPLIALFSGCRLNEICSLYLKDIFNACYNYAPDLCPRMEQLLNYSVPILLLPPGNPV
jgi:integrase